jgi:hypothetical protein
MELNMGKEFLMKKRLSKGFSAAVAAVILAVMTVILPVSASFIYNGGSYPGTRQYPSAANLYATENAYSSGLYWYPNIDAYYELNPDRDKPSIVKETVKDYSSDNSYFNYETGEYEPDNIINSPYRYKIDRFISNKSGDRVAYKGSTDSVFYPTEELAVQMRYSGTYLRKYPSRGDGNYFNNSTGRFYKTRSDALAATGDAEDVFTEVDGVWYDRNYTETYFNNKAGKYYLTEAEAKASANGGEIKRYVTPTQGYFFNRYTGDFYLTQAAATDNEIADDVVEAASFSFSNGIFNSFGVPIANYGSPIYTPTGSGTGTSSVSGAPEGNMPGSSTSSAASTAPTVSGTSQYDADSTAVLRSNYNYRGWESIAGVVGRLSSGTNITILTNRDTYASSTFMKAVAGKDINVTLTNSNGSQIKFNGLDVYSAKDMPISVVYNSRMPAEAYDNALRTANAETASSFAVGTEVDLGAVVQLNIPFNNSRIGYTVELYLYNSANGKTSLVDTKIITDDSVAVFEIRKGGQYVACIKK